MFSIQVRRARDCLKTDDDNSLVLSFWNVFRLFRSFGEVLQDVSLFSENRAKLNLA